MQPVHNGATLQWCNSSGRDVNRFWFPSPFLDRSSSTRRIDMTRRASTRGLLALGAALALMATAGGQAAAQKAGGTPILSGPLAKLDIKPAQIDTARGTPKGVLTVAMHFALDRGCLDPLEHSYAITMQMYDYLVHDAMIKPMNYGYATYGLAEHAELSADFRRAAFQLRSGLKFHDGQPLTTADVKWTYENFKGASAKLFHDKLEHIQIADDRTIVFHFKEPFIDFMDLYNGGIGGHRWDLPQQHHEKGRRDRVQGQPDRGRPAKVLEQHSG